MNGEKRSERNERFGVAVPDWGVPEAGEYLWDWFFELDDGINRFDNGRVVGATWNDIDAWLRLSRHVVNPSEIRVLKSMDQAYCAALQGELTYTLQQAAANKGRG